MPRTLKLRYDKIDFSTTVVCQDAVTSEVDLLSALGHLSIVRTHGELRGPLPMNGPRVRAARRGTTHTHYALT